LRDDFLAPRLSQIVTIDEWIASKQRHGLLRLMVSGRFRCTATPGIKPNINPGHFPWPPERDSRRTPFDRLDNRCDGLGIERLGDSDQRDRERSRLLLAGAHEVVRRGSPVGNARLAAAGSSGAMSSAESSYAGLFQFRRSKKRLLNPFSYLAEWAGVNVRLSFNRKRVKSRSLFGNRSAAGTAALILVSHDAGTRPFARRRPRQANRRLRI